MYILIYHSWYVSFVVYVSFDTYIEVLISMCNLHYISLTTLIIYFWLYISIIYKYNFSSHSISHLSAPWNGEETASRGGQYHRVHFVTLVNSSLFKIRCLDRSHDPPTASMWDFPTDDWPLPRSLEKNWQWATLAHVQKHESLRSVYEVHNELEYPS